MPDPRTMRRSRVFGNHVDDRHLMVAYAPHIDGVKSFVVDVVDFFSMWHLYMDVYAVDDTDYTQESVHG